VTFLRKDDVRDFWNDAVCGEKLLLPSLDLEGFQAQAEARYHLEPYISEFARFSEITVGEVVLEIGLGLGADHERLAKTGARLHGIDLSTRAVEITRLRLSLQGLTSDLRVADAEALPFRNNSFDFVYSWGVIHHTTDTAKAAREILRVLKPGGHFRVMVYHKWSLVGVMLWIRYGLGMGKPWTSLRTIYATYLESPGTQAFSRKEAHRLFEGVIDLRLRVALTHGDLLESGAGQRHRGFCLTLARRLWPRWLLRRVARPFGLFLMISGTKGSP
jgi:SAM-dependent methyltransferase